MNRRANQPLWFSIASLAQIYELGESTVRQKVKSGEFGVVTDPRFVLEIAGMLRVSSLGTFFFEQSHPCRYDDAQRRRNAEELRRRMKLGEKPAEFVPVELEAQHA